MRSKFLRWRILFGPAFARRSIGPQEWTEPRLRAGGKPVSTFPGYALEPCSAPLALVDGPLGVGRLDAEGRAIRHEGETQAWILRDRNAALHREDDVLALRDFQLVDEIGRDVEMGE